MSHRNLKNEDPALSKITTKDDEIEESKYETENHDSESLKSHENDNDSYRRKYNSLN